MTRGDVRLERSRREVLGALAGTPAASRKELQIRTGLGASTIATVVRDLIAEGRVREARIPRSGGHAPRGRPTSQLVLAELSGYVLGIAIGHTAVTVGLATTAEHMLAERTVRVSEGREAGELFGLVENVVAELTAQCGVPLADIRAAALSVPAPIDPDTGRVYDRSLVPASWRGLRPARELGSRLGIPMVAVNDANAGAVAEHLHGAGRDVSDLVYVNATTGIGAGLILAGDLYTGNRGRAGEIGHIRLQGASALCFCGQRGCLDTEASAHAVARKIAAGGIAMSANRSIDVVLHEHRFDPVVVQLVAEVGRDIGNVLADACNVLAPSKVIIGGELAEAGTGLRDGLYYSLCRFASDAVSRSVSVELSRLGLRAGVVGTVAIAAARARDEGMGAGKRP